jgi:hypothetical protein
VSNPSICAHRIEIGSQHHLPSSIVWLWSSAVIIALLSCGARAVFAPTFSFAAFAGLAKAHSQNCLQSVSKCGTVASRAPLRLSLTLQVRVLNLRFTHFLESPSRIVPLQSISPASSRRRNFTMATPRVLASSKSTLSRQVSNQFLFYFPSITISASASASLSFRPTRLDIFDMPLSPNADVRAPRI